MMPFLSGTRSFTGAPKSSSTRPSSSPSAAKIGELSNALKIEITTRTRFIIRGGSISWRDNWRKFLRYGRSYFFDTVRLSLNPSLIAP